MIADASRNIEVAAKVVKKSFVGDLAGVVARDDRTADRRDPVAQRRFLLHSAKFVDDRQWRRLGQAKLLFLVGLRVRIRSTSLSK
jgi:hypothetical protein